MKTLGLELGMSTYFAHAPNEYFEALGHRTFTHRPDDDGMYDFIHAFFTEKEQLEASAGILLSKLADDGVLWISWPKQGSTINEDLIEQSIKGLQAGIRETISITNAWWGIPVTWKT
jgi:hypothetical protein